jgi:hypothetical protein
MRRRLAVLFSLAALVQAGAAGAAPSEDEIKHGRTVTVTVTAKGPVRRGKVHLIEGDHLVVTVRLSYASRHESEAGGAPLPESDGRWWEHLSWTLDNSFPTSRTVEASEFRVLSEAGQPRDALLRPGQWKEVTLEMVEPLPVERYALVALISGTAWLESAGTIKPPPAVQFVVERRTR